MPRPQDDVPCCADPADATGSEGKNANGAAGTTSASGPAETQKKYQEFLRAATAPGALDVHTKQAIAIALSVHAKCEPCLKMHLQKAREKGFSDEEIDEAAWLAISFGGSPLMVFYNEVKKSLARR